MSAASLRDTLSTATDLLLSPESTQVDYEVALSALERVVASLALDRADPPPTPLAPTQLDAFLTLQDGFEYNVTATLLEWLGRAVAELRRGQSADDQERTRTNLARVLGLVQGLLLLHRRSQRLFARRATLEYMLTILQHSRSSSLLGSPSFPPTTPSPVLLPPSPSPSSSSSSHSRTSSPSRSSSPLLSSPNSLALTALDTLLCALVDRPRNMRAFEAVGGLGAIVKVLKDKSVAQVVRIKAIEILYFYLLPERPPSTRRSTSSSSSSASSCYSDISSSDPFLSATPLTRSPILPSLLANAASDFVPQTPHKPRHHHQRQSSSVSSTETSFLDPPPPPTPAPPPQKKDEDGTPKASRNESATTATPRRARGAPPPFILVDEGTPRGPTPPTSSNGGRTGSEGSERRARPGATRTTAEKREILRAVMPNVEALEHRFEAMGLGGWEA